MGDVVSQVDLPLENSEKVSTQLRIADCALLTEPIACPEWVELTFSVPTPTNQTAPATHHRLRSQTALKSQNINRHLAHEVALTFGQPFQLLINVA